MDKKLENFLNKNKVKYETFEHRKVYTAFDEAETQGIKAREVAKTVLIKADSDLYLVVIPAAKNVDLTKVKKKLKAKKIAMAKENDITKKLKTKIGLLHPFGPVYGLPVLIDSPLLKQKVISTSAGSYTESLDIKPSIFEKLVEPLKGSFSKIKK